MTGWRVAPANGSTRTTRSWRSCYPGGLAGLPKLPSDDDEHEDDAEVDPPAR